LFPIKEPGEREQMTKGKGEEGSKGNRPEKGKKGVPIMAGRPEGFENQLKRGRKFSI